MSRQYIDFVPKNGKRKLAAMPMPEIHVPTTPGVSRTTRRTVKTTQVVRRSQAAQMARPARSVQGTQAVRTAQMTQRSQRTQAPRAPRTSQASQASRTRATEMRPAGARAAGTRGPAVRTTTRGAGVQASAMSVTRKTVRDEELLDDPMERPISEFADLEELAQEIEDVTRGGVIEEETQYVDAGSVPFSLQPGPQLGAVENYQPRFISASVEKRPLSGGVAEAQVVTAWGTTEKQANAPVKRPGFARGLRGAVEAKMVRPVAKKMTKRFAKGADEAQEAAPRNEQKSVPREQRLASQERRSTSREQGLALQEQRPAPRGQRPAPRDEQRPMPYGRRSMSQEMEEYEANFPEIASAEDLWGEEAEMMTEPMTLEEQDAEMMQITELQGWGEVVENPVENFEEEVTRAEVSAGINSAAARAMAMQRAKEKQGARTTGQNVWGGQALRPSQSGQRQATYAAPGYARAGAMGAQPRGATRVGARTASGASAQPGMATRARMTGAQGGAMQGARTQTPQMRTAQAMRAQFVNQDKVPKRPLSGGASEAAYGLLTEEERRGLGLTNEKGQTKKADKKRKGGSAGTVLMIIGAIILGAIVGTVAFLLLPR